MDTTQEVEDLRIEMHFKMEAFMRVMETVFLTLLSCTSNPSKLLADIKFIILSNPQPTSLEVPNKDEIELMQQIILQSFFDKMERAWTEKGKLDTAQSSSQVN